MSGSAHESFALLFNQLWAGDVTTRVLRDARKGAMDLKLAVDAREVRHLLAAIPDDYEFTEVVGNHISLGDWRHPATGQRYLDLACTEPSLSSAFSALTDDVVRRVEEHHDSAAYAVQETLAEWRALLQPASSLSEEKARGLFGEMWVLGLLAARSPYYALDVWTGPLGEPHDFTSPSGDIEVKTSKLEGLDVVVSDLHQLDPLEGRDLVLVRVSVVTDPDGVGLREQADSLCSMGLVREELAQKLARQGFHLDGKSPDFSFRVQEVNSWRVGVDFPGLRSEDIELSRRRAIKKITYTLDLALAGAPMAPEELDSHIARMVGGPA